MNTIQFLNEHSLDELEKKGVKSNYIKAVNVFIFNYEQVPPEGAFPKNHPIIAECRNLVLRDKPWRIISQSFVRFFNWNEDVEETKRMTQKMTEGKVSASVKMDGSLVAVTFDSELDQWLVFTRGSYADTNPFRGLSNVLSFEMVDETEEKTTKKKISRCPASDDNDTFGLRVRKYLNFEKLDKNFTYVFELCTPGAHITKYAEETLTLLMVRDKRTGKEVSIDDIDVAPKPAKFFPKSINDVYDVIKTMPVDFEGYVLSYVADEDFVADGRQVYAGDVLRMKVKSETYVALHHLGIKAYTLDDLVRIVLVGEKDEVSATIPEYKEYLNHVSENLDKQVAEIMTIYEQNKTLPRRDFAQVVKNHPYAWFFFKMHSNAELAGRIKNCFAEEKTIGAVISSFKKAYYA